MFVVERPGGPGRAEFVPGEVLVKLKDPAAAEEAAAWGRANQGAISLKASAKLTAVFRRFGVDRAAKPFARSKSASHRRVLKLNSPELKNDPERTKALASELQNEPEVEYAELNLIMRAQAAPNDPYYSSSGAWGQPFRDLWGLQKINAEAAWATTLGENVVVAVIDTGVDYNHEDIAANISLNAGETGSDAAGRDRKTNGVDDDRNGFVDDWRGWDFVTYDGTPDDNNPMDDHGHGTHVAGTIAAVSGNALGIVGVAPAARVMALKGLSSSGSGTLEDLSRAILYAADNGARVINASWGALVSSPVRTLIDSIGYAHDVKGAVFVAAAGNSSADVGDQDRGFTPANIRDAVTVSAFDNTDARASFSNYGSKVDVAAPGGGDQDATGAVAHPGRSILSLQSSLAVPGMTGSGQLVVGAKYVRQMGTSMASPHAAGVAALILARNPEYSAEQVRQALRLGSDDVGVAGPDQNSGHGRVNAAKALTVAYPLSVQLTDPLGTVAGQTEVSVRGTAAGAGFLSWRLEYGVGSNPSSWTHIATSITPVSDGQLAVWDLTQVLDGVYTLRLVAQNIQGGTFEDRLRVRIDNILITEPAYDPSLLEPVSFIRGGQLISIKGTVAPHNFSSYSISVEDGTDRAFPGAKITLANDGLQKVRDGVLGTWDTTGVPTDSYTIRLTVRLTNATFHETTHVIVDPSIHPGWPLSLGPHNAGGLSPALTNHLNAHDINGDGAKDLIVGYGNTVRIFDHTGALLPGWPRRVDSIYAGAIIQQSPAVGDLDGDGKLEIVGSNNTSEIFVWRADGTPYPGWPKHFGGALNSITLSDLNNDGADEIIAADWEGRVKVLNKDGGYLPGWPPYLASDILLPVCVADLDGDRQKELVVATFANQTKLFALRSNGTIMPGWPLTINASAQQGRGYWSYPALGDLDGDRDLEIVIGSGDGYVHAFHHTGAAVTGWPKFTMAAVVNSPAVGDLNGDGKAEVIAGIETIREGWDSFNYLYAWHGDGTPLTGWPVKSLARGYFLSPGFGFGAPAIADVDGDRAPDIVVSGSNSNFQVVRAYKADGSPVAGFPKAGFDAGAYSANTVAVADLDNDGQMEMAWIDFSLHLYVWDLPSPADAPAPWPMFHHDVRHTGAPTPADSVSVGGRVTLGANGLAGVTMTLSSTSAGFTPLTVSTGAAGSYTFTDLPKGAAYTVRPSKSGYAFTPAGRSFSNVTASVTGVNFEAAAAVPKVNHALSTAGATAAATSTLDQTRLPRAAINGDRKGLHWGSDPSTGSGWTDATKSSFPDRLEVTFPGPRTVDEVSVFGLQDNFQSPAEPTEEMTSTAYTLTSFAVEYWTGSAWAAVPGGGVTGNNKVWRKLTFPAVTTTKVRLTVNSALNSYSRVAEFEAWGPASSGPPPRTNVAASTAGATATATSTLDSTRLPVAAINGDRRGLHWGSGPSTGSGWTDATKDLFPDRLEVTFSGAKAITEVSVFGLQDNFQSPVEPTEQMVSNTYALQDFDVEYWTGSAWAPAPGGQVTGNNRVWRKFTFPAITTTKIRVTVRRAQASYSRIVEVEAY